MAERLDRESGPVVAVLGYSSRRGRKLHPICANRLAHGQRLAVGARAVILSGWARGRPGLPEAELMRAAWTGPDVPLVCDRDARSTADNAANVVAAACALGADELLVVTSWWHRPRAWVLLRAALQDHKLRLSVEAPRGPRPPGLLARELACLLFLPLQLLRVRRLAAGRGGPRPLPASAGDEPEARRDAAQRVARSSRLSRRSRSATSSSKMPFITQ